MNRYQVEYYDSGETWLDTVSAESEEDAIEQVKNEHPSCEVKGAYKLEEYTFAEPEEERDTLDLTTDRFEPKARWNEWGEFTDSGRELQESLYNVLADKELYPDDITVKEKDGVTKVYIDIGGDWKHEHGYLRHVMTDELGYMEINQETLPDDFYSDGGDSYRARHTFIMFPDLMKFNEMRGIKNSKQIRSNYYRIHYNDYRLPVGQIKDTVIVEAPNEKSARDEFNKHSHYGATIDKVVECDEFGNDLVKSSFENFDEYPAQSIIKVWKKEKGYNVDTMNLFFDDYIYEDKWIPTKEIKNIEKEYREWLWNYCVENQIDTKQFRELDNTFGLYTPAKLLESSKQINSMAIKQIERYYQDGILTKREVIAILMRENGWDFPQAKQIADYYERVYVNQSVVSGHQKNINSLDIIFNEKEI